MRLIKLEQCNINDLTLSDRKLPTIKELAKLTLIPNGNDKAFGYDKKVIQSVDELELISIVELIKVEQNKRLHIIEHA